MRLQWLTVSACLVLACSDDGGSRDVDTQGPGDDTSVDTVNPDADAPDTSDTSDATGSDTDGDDVAGDSQDASDGADGDGWPEVSYAEPLPVATSFDVDYVSVGDLVATTLVETYRPRHGFSGYLTEAGALRVPLAAVGKLEPQPGEPHLLRSQLALPDVGAAPLVAGQLPLGARSLFYGLVLADTQIVDVDSPAQVAKNASISTGPFPFPPAYRAHGEFVPQLVDALVRTANRFQVSRRYDAALVVGDLVENSHTNELAWLHALLLGGAVLPDSGARDDIEPGPANDAFDPFVAEGLTPGTPWVVAVGNHDLLINGNFPVDLMAAVHADPLVLEQLETKVRPLGITVPGDPLSDQYPAWFPHPMRSAFRIDPEHFHPLQVTQLAELAALQPDTQPADAQRQPEGRCGFIEAHRAIGGVPAGHGFTARNEEDCTGWFAYDAVPGLRVLSLELGPVEGGSYGILGRPAKDGALDLAKAGDPRWDQIAFLESELQRAEEERVALIVISHQRSSDLRTDALLRGLIALFGDTPELKAIVEREVPEPVDALSTEAFRKLLASSGNVIGHLAGHTHANGIVAICADGTERGPEATPCSPGPNDESGYWEITTAAGVGYPHQGRILEVVQVEGRLGAFYATNIDPRWPAGSFVERGLYVSLAARQMGTGDWGGPLGAPADRNVLLPFVVPQDVADAWGPLTLSTKIESETTLLETAPALVRLPVRE